MTFCILIVIVIVILKAFSAHKTRQQNALNRQMIEEVTDMNRGESSERNLILNLRQLNIPANQIFHDLLIPYARNYSQVDAVVVSNVGLIVIEVKDYSGWLFGNGHQDYWTQVLNFGQEKYRFYNPVKQNETHLKALRIYLEEEIPCYSVIIFYGDCIIKKISAIPPNTYIGYRNDLMTIIQHIKADNPKYSYRNIGEVFERLKTAVNNGDDPAKRELQVARATSMKDKNKPEDKFEYRSYFRRRGYRRFR